MARGTAGGRGYAAGEPDPERAVRLDRSYHLQDSTNSPFFPTILVDEPAAGASLPCRTPDAQGVQSDERKSAGSGAGALAGEWREPRRERPGGLLRTGLAGPVRSD